MALRFRVIDETLLMVSQKVEHAVFPAKAGIQCSPARINSWTPFFNGVTTYYESISLQPKYLGSSSVFQGQIQVRCQAHGYNSLIDLDFFCYFKILYPDNFFVGGDDL
jgi:hypothetical protein